MLGKSVITLYTNIKNNIARHWRLFNAHMACLLYNNLIQQWLKTIQKGNIFYYYYWYNFHYYTLLSYSLYQHVFFQLSNLISTQEPSIGPVSFVQRLLHKFYVVAHWCNKRKIGYSIITLYNNIGNI